MDKKPETNNSGHKSKINTAKRSFQCVAFISEWIYPEQAEEVMRRIEAIKDWIKKDNNK